MPTRRPRTLDLATLALHAGAEEHDADTPVVSPLYQSVNFVQEVGTAEGLRYPRYGNAPNAEIVQRRVAALEGAEAAVVLASGMGATACALLALLRPGDHLLASGWIYGGTERLFTVCSSRRKPVTLFALSACGHHSVGQEGDNP